MDLEKYGRRSFVFGIGAAGLLSMASCADLPRDPDGTLDRVRSSELFRVGLVERDGGASQREIAFLDALAETVRARPVIRGGAAEPLLLQLEKGELDLVLGEFEATSPWASRVTFIPPLTDASGGDGTVSIVAATRNGENAWIKQLHVNKATLGEAS